MEFPGGRAESDQSVGLESFTPGSLEVGVKMVNGCTLTEGHPLRSYWVFLGGLTNAGFEITIEDTVTGQMKIWRNPAGTFPQTIGDTSAFPCVTGQVRVLCVRDARTACLIEGRFRVTGVMADFNTPPNEVATRVMSFPSGRAASNQAALFESFRSGNLEVGVKMVDGCSLPPEAPLRAYWVFYGGLTNAETRIVVTDTANESMDVWENPAGTFPVAEGRTNAFPCE
jgi:hypothetical protein